MGVFNASWCESSRIRFRMKCLPIFRGHLNIKISSYQYRDPHVKDKTWERQSLYWDRSLVPLPKAAVPWCIRQLVYNPAVNVEADTRSQAGNKTGFTAGQGHWIPSDQLLLTAAIMDLEGNYIILGWVPSTYYRKYNSVWNEKTLCSRTFMNWCYTSESALTDIQFTILMHVRSFWNNMGYTVILVDGVLQQTDRHS